MLREFPNLASTSVSLRGMFWLYASKDGGGAALADLLDLAVLFLINMHISLSHSQPLSPIQKEGARLFTWNINHYHYAQEKLPYYHLPFLRHPPTWLSEGIHR